MSTKQAEQLPATIAGIDSNAIRAIDEAIDQYSLTASNGKELGGEFSKALLMAEGMETLQKLLTPQIMKSVNTLQGSRLGFQTDKRPGEVYHIDVVKKCFIEAVIRGARPVGNEFNIIVVILPPKI